MSSYIIYARYLSAVSNVLSNNLPTKVIQWAWMTPNALLHWIIIISSSSSNFTVNNICLMWHCISNRAVIVSLLCVCVCVRFAHVSHTNTHWMWICVCMHVWCYFNFLNSLGCVRYNFLDKYTFICECLNRCNCISRYPKFTQFLSILKNPIGCNFRKWCKWFLGGGGEVLM